jgi:hypothetical protein
MRLSTEYLTGKPKRWVCSTGLPLNLRGPPSKAGALSPTKSPTDRGPAFVALHISTWIAENHLFN